MTGEVVETVELLTSEVITNALVHAHSADRTVERQELAAHLATERLLRALGERRPRGAPKQHALAFTHGEPHVAAGQADDQHPGGVDQFEARSQPRPRCR